MPTKHQYHLDKDVFFILHLDDDLLELRSFSRNIQTNKKNISFNIF